MKPEGPGKKKFCLHVISNTHWDREWVYPFQETRLLLVEFMDRLLDILGNDHKFHSFLLDAQTIAVEDYLALRPEREKEIRKLVRSGRLIVGPWYTLPEEYIVNGESLVRNLVVGHRLAAKWGKVSKTGYTPFSYGQTSQMPQIYRGFDIDTIIFYRGINTPKSEFIMESPDGSRVTGCRFGALSRFSYYFYVYRKVRYGMSRDEWWYDWDRGGQPFRLCSERHPWDHYYVLDPQDRQWNEDVLPEQLRKLLEDESHHFTTSHIACMQGFDTSSPDPRERELIEASRPVLKKMGHEIKQDSLEMFMRDMMRELEDPFVIRGESRDPGATGKWTHLFGDVISSRTRIKRLNAQTELLIQRWAEPFSAAGWMAGGSYMRSAIDLAWRYLLQNHPHDTICGAGIDQMEKDMIYRFDQACIISQGVMRRGMADIQRGIDNRDIGPMESVLTVFNPSPFARSEVMTFTADLPDRCGYKWVSVRDPEGKAMPAVEVKREPAGTLVRNLEDISLRQVAERITFHLDVKDVPPLGYRVYHLRPEKESRIPAPPVVRSAGRRVMENAFLKVTFHSNGSLDILDKETGHTFGKQHYFEDSGESGNAWIHMSPEKDRIVTTLKKRARITIEESNSLIIRYRVEHSMQIPHGLEGKPGAYRRAGEKRILPVTSVFTLRKDQRWLHVRTRVTNTAEQHRLRVCFPTGLAVRVSAAEAAFDVTERPVERTQASLYYGKPNPQYPMHRFVDMSDGRRGLAVLNDGIREFEAVDDAQRTLAITLLRCFTAMQSPVIDQMEIYPWMKLSQSPGEHEWQYAIMPHRGGWEAGKVMIEAEKFTLPMEASQSGKGGGSLPKEAGFLSVEPEDIMISALKQSETRESLLIRLFNPTGRDIETCLTFFLPVKSAWMTNLNEERRSGFPVQGRKVCFTMAHKKILTLEVVFKNMRKSFKKGYQRGVR